MEIDQNIAEAAMHVMTACQAINDHDALTARNHLASAIAHLVDAITPLEIYLNAKPHTLIIEGHTGDAKTLENTTQLFCPDPNANTN